MSRRNRVLYQRWRSAAEITSEIMTSRAYARGQSDFANGYHRNPYKDAYGNVAPQEQDLSDAWTAGHDGARKQYQDALKEAREQKEVFSHGEG